MTPRRSKSRLTSGRARRALKIGELASRMGSSYLWNSIKGPFLSETEKAADLARTHVKNARRIVESSKQLRGAFTKLIQMLSMRADLMPAEALDLLRATQSDIPPMDYATISAQIRRELGKNPEQLFASFDTEAFAAASLGQVHRGRLKNGAEVAVKIQYPGVAETVEQDLLNMKLLLKTLQAVARDVMRQKIDARATYIELEQRLREELDYVSEARNIAEFGALVADDPEIVTPRVVKELSSRRILTMTFVDGYRLTDLMNPAADEEIRMWVARKHFRLVWRQILEFGLLHTDPHPGNYLVTYHPRLGILDFGSMRRFPEPIRKAHLQLARGLVASDDTEIGQAMGKLGYLDRGQDPQPMVEIVRILFEPLLVDRSYDPRDYDAVGKASMVGDIAFKHKLYKLPGHNVFLLRALIGLDGILRGLAIPMNYRELFRECVAEING